MISGEVVSVLVFREPHIAHVSLIFVLICSKQYCYLLFWFDKAIVYIHIACYSKWYKPGWNTLEVLWALPAFSNWLIKVILNALIPFCLYFPLSFFRLHLIWILLEMPHRWYTKLWIFWHLSYHKGKKNT